MHHSEPIINEQQSNQQSTSVSVDNTNLSAHHYQHSHQQSQSQHVALMANQTAKTDNIDYNIHRVNDSSIYNQMVYFFIN